VKYPIEHDDFQGRDLAVRIDGVFSSAKLYEGPSLVSGSRNKFVLRDNHGQERTIQLRATLLDPLPVVEIDDEKIRLDRALAWYEYLWAGLPVVLIFAGGALGGLFGASAAFVNARVFRSDRSNPVKYALSALASVGAATGYVVGVVGLQYAIAAFQEPTSKAALSDVAEATNRTLPMMVDDQTEFFEAKGLEGVLVLKYRLPSASSGEVDTDQFLSVMTPTVRANACADAELRPHFLDNGVVLRFSYAASDRTEFATIDIDAGHCK